MKLATRVRLATSSAGFSEKKLTGSSLNREGRAHHRAAFRATPRSAGLAVQPTEALRNE